MMTAEDTARAMGIVARAAESYKLTVESIMARDFRKYISAARRAVMLALHQNGFTHMQIAEVMHREPETVKNGIAKAKEEFYLA